MLSTRNSLQCNVIDSSKKDAENYFKTRPEEKQDVQYALGIVFSFVSSGFQPTR